MDDRTLAYDLSFRRSGVRGLSCPAFVITVPERFDLEMQRRLVLVKRHIDAQAERYWPDIFEFRTGQPDLFGNRVFGYGNVGRAERGDYGIDYIVECRSHDTVSGVVLTLSAILHCASYLADSGHSSNSEQIARVDTRTSPGEHYGHAVSGTVYAPFIRWLVHRSKLKGSNGQIPSPAGVRASMRELWRHIAPQYARCDLRKYDKACSVRITDDGRFQLNCFGDACDLAIYPDQASEVVDGMQRVEFSCHNLDQAHQQLTLLAGFATMCALARVWNEKQENNW